MHNIAIDMGGTRLKIGIFSDDILINHSVIPSCAQESFDNTVKNIEDQIVMLMKSVSIAAIDGIGLSIPGIVDPRRNKILDINAKYRDAIDFNLDDWTKSVWNAKLVTENDARAALLGEWKNGSGKEIENIAMITLGTGIGGAVLIEGKLLHGKHYQAGCLGGHFTIDFQGDICNCGNRGCVETRGSSWVLPEIAKKEGYTKSELNFKDLFNAIHTDEKAATLLHSCMDAWGACAVNLIHAYDPEMVIIGGGVMNSSGIILDHVRDYVNKYAWTPWGQVKLAKAELGDTAALYGMNYLLKQ